MGSPVKRHLRSGRPSCRCRNPEFPGHGPFWYLTTTVAGKSVNLTAPAQAVERARELIARYERLLTLIEELVEVNEQFCNAHLQRERGRAAEKRAFAAAFAGETGAAFGALAGRAANLLDLEAVETAARRVDPRVRRQVV